MLLSPSLSKSFAWLMRSRLSQSTGDDPVAFRKRRKKCGTLRLASRANSSTFQGRRYSRCMRCKTVYNLRSAVSSAVVP